MKRANLQVEMLPIEALTEYENNARAHGREDIEAIEWSIQQFGFNDPIGIWSTDNVIVEGHGRLKAAKNLGMTEVPVIRLDHMTNEERKAYALAHNKTAELSMWDFGKLDLELAGIHELDMTKLGFEPLEEIPEISDDEYDFDNTSAENRTQRGQVWLLGNHRLMCGDSANEEDVQKLMGGVRPKLVFTDPPYGVAIGDKNKFLNSIQESGRILENIENDTLSTDELYDLLLKAFTLLKEHCDDDCSYYVTSPQGGEIGLMMMMMRDAGLEVRHNLIWEKSSATFSMGRLDYDYKHEPIFYTWTKKHKFYGKGQCKNTVWQFPKPRKCDLHPTMKPVELVAECLLNSSAAGDPVADIFGGSGTTLIACEQLNRKCFMMELDPHYCDVIIDRWEQLTGREAQLISN